jgi:menaquinone-specific isochorismate synthase
MINSLINNLRSQLEDFQTNKEYKLENYKYISLTCPVNSLISLTPPDCEHCFYLCKPNSGLTLVGLGSLITIKTSGKHRFSSLKKEYTNLLKKWYQKDKTKSKLVQAFIAFAFDEKDKMSKKWQDYPNTLLTIPNILITETTNNKGKKVQYLEINLKFPQDKNIPYSKNFDTILNQLKHYLKQTNQSLVAHHYIINKNPDKKTNKSTWKLISTNAIKQIKLGTFDKVVLSRCCSLKVDNVISLKSLVRNLVGHYPSCTIVSYQINHKTIVAASPERLFSLHNHIIKSDAIGGTIKKSNKKNSLFNFKPDSAINQKLLKEHLFISHEIYQCLDTLCNTLKMPVSPVLMMLHNMYHLETSIEGILKPQYDFFNLLETLHPTPAVAGFPSPQSKQWLIENETYKRGWYSGSFGLVDSLLNGEMSVMLRCALIKGKKITLFAGAGLVAESDLEAERQEIEIKMHTILDRL